MTPQFSVEIALQVAGEIDSYNMACVDIGAH
jgi:hypothetical protein